MFGILELGLSIQLPYEELRNLKPANITEMKRGEQETQRNEELRPRIENQGTVEQNQGVMRHLIIHFATSSGVTE